MLWTPSRGIHKNRTHNLPLCCLFFTHLDTRSSALRHITDFASFCGDNQSLIRETEPIQRLKLLKVITLLAHKDAPIVCEFVEESDDKLRKLQFAPTSVFFNVLLLEIKNVLRKKNDSFLSLYDAQWEKYICQNIQ